MSDFEQQVSQDHPELAAAECKGEADMLQRCAEYAAKVAPRFLADNPGAAINKVPGNSKAEWLFVDRMHIVFC